MNQPVSIICPYRDAGEFLPGLIDNVLSQTYRSWELLLIDDGSVDDGPLFALRAACSDLRIRALSASKRPSGSPMGPWWPRNVGLRHAQYDLIAFLDVDDLWHPSKLQRQLHCHLSASASLSVTAYARFGYSTRRILGWRSPPPSFGYRRLRNNNVIPMLSVLVHRSIITEQFRPCPHEDYLFWLAILRCNPRARCIGIPELLAFYAVHDGNLTRSRWKMPFWAFQVYRSHGMGPINSGLALVPWALSQMLSLARSNRIGIDLSVDQLLSRRCPLSVPTFDKASLG